MRNFAFVLWAFAGDMVPMGVFLGAVLATGNIFAATGVGIAASAAQLGWATFRHQPIGALQWASLGLIVVLGGATLLTRDPRFVMLKPTAIDIVLGAVMLRRGWMERYVPEAARMRARPMLAAFGRVWAALMFLTGALNLAIAMLADPITWARFNLVFPTVSMVGLFVIQNAIMRRRMAAIPP